MQAPMAGRRSILSHHQNLISLGGMPSPQQPFEPRHRAPSHYPSARLPTAAARVRRTVTAVCLRNITSLGRWASQLGWMIPGRIRGGTIIYFASANRWRALLVPQIAISHKRAACDGEPRQAVSRIVKEQPYYRVGGCRALIGVVSCLTNGDSISRNLHSRYF